MAQNTQSKGGPGANLILSVIIGPTVYTLHFLVVYALVEAGCRTGLFRNQIAGFSVVNVLIFVLTIVAAGLTGVAAWISYRRWQRSRYDSDVDDNSYRTFLTFVGVGVNGFHTLLILLTGLPTLMLVLCEWI